MRLTLICTLLLWHAADAQELLHNKLPHSELHAFCLCVPDAGYTNDPAFSTFTDSLRFLPALRQRPGRAMLQLVVDTDNEAQAISYDGEVTPEQVSVIANYLVTYRRWNTAYMDSHPTAFTVVVHVAWDEERVAARIQPLHVDAMMHFFSDPGTLVVQNEHYRYRNNPRKQYRITSWNHKEDGLSHDFGASLTVDRFNAVWEGTMEGVSRLYDDHIQTYGLDNSILKTSTGREELITAAATDVADNKWLCGVKTLYLYDNKHWSVIDTAVSGQRRIQTITPTADGRVYFAGDNGLSIYFQGAWTHPTLPIPNQALFYAAADKKGRLWIGSRAGAFVVKDGQTTPCTFLAGLTITHMTEDDEGNCWFSTYAYDKTLNAPEGLAECDTAGHWSLLTIDNSGLPSGHIENLLYNPNDHAVWLCIQHAGLCRFDRKKDWQLITTQNSALPSVETSALAVDADGNIWCATHAGLARLTPLK